MVRTIVNEIFAIVNERREVNEVWMKFLFLIFVSSGNVDLSCIHTQHISAIVNKMANSSVLTSHLKQSTTYQSLQRNRTVVQ